YAAGATSETGPGAIAGGLAGVGVGTYAGKALDDLRKAAVGIYRKTPVEELQHMNRDALWMMAFDTLGPSAKTALKPVWHGVRRYLTELTPEIEQAAQKAVDIGGQPTSNAAPGLKLTQSHENFFQQM